MGNLLLYWVNIGDSRGIEVKVLPGPFSSFFLFVQIFSVPNFAVGAGHFPRVY